MNIITICARGGSQGVPGKNIRPLLGKPLIGWTIEQAIASGVADRIFISTDDAEIAAVAQSFGAEVPFLRPAELATSSAAKLPVVQHLVNHIEAELLEHGQRIAAVIDLDPTSPLRNPSDIRACADLLDSDSETDIVITGYESDKNPYFNMVEQKASGYFGRVCEPVSEVFGRQQAPKVYSMNASIYAWRRPALTASLWSTPCIRLHAMPRERSIDIDSSLDFDLVELIMKRKREQQ